MGLFGGLFKPIRSAAKPFRAAYQAFRNYDAAGTGRPTGSWTPTAGSANSVVQSSGPQLARRARDSVRNDPYAERIVSILTANLVGAGITTRWKSKPHQDAWNKWADSVECSYDGSLNLAGIQALATSSMIESGEVLILLHAIRPTNDNPIGLQLQMLESDHLDWHKNGVYGDALIIQGVEVNQKGQPVAYWLFPQHPGSTWPIVPTMNLQSVRVPAANVVHYYRQRRPGQVRGVSWLAPVLLRLRDLADYEGALQMKAKIEACLVLVASGEGDEEAGDRFTDASGRVVESFEPGMILYRKNAGELEVVNPSSAGAHTQFAKRALEASAVGTNLTYDQLSGDLSGANYSSLRAGKIEFRRFIEQMQAVLVTPKLIAPIVTRFHLQGALLGLWDADRPDGIMHVPPANEMVDPLKDITALIAQVRAGLIPPQEAAAMFGYDFETVIKMIKDANAVLDKSGVILDTDPRRMAKVGSANDPRQLAAIEIAATGAALPRPDPAATDQPPGQDASNAQP